MIVRPPEYLEDVRERELEMQAAEARLAAARAITLCPHCDAEVEKDFLRCPNCMRKLKDPCRACGRPLDPGWKICPFCETEVGAAAPTARRRRRRARPGGASLDGAERSRRPAARPASAAGRPAVSRRSRQTAVRPPAAAARAARRPSRPRAPASDRAIPTAPTRRAPRMPRPWSDP